MLKAVPFPCYSSRRAGAGWRTACLLGALAVAGLLTTPAMAQDASAAPTTATTEADKTKLKPVLKPAPRVVSLKPVRKGETPEPEVTPAPLVEKADPAPAEKPAAEAEKAVAGPTAPEASKRTAKPAAKPKSAETAKTESSDIRQNTLSELLSGPADAATRAKLRAFVIEHHDTPESARALLKLGEINMKLNNPQEAVMAWQSVKRIKGADPALLEQAETALAAMENAATPGTSPVPAPPAANRPAFDPAPLAATALELTLNGKYEEADRAWKALDEALLSPPGPVDATVAVTMQARLLLGRALTAEMNRNDDEARRLLTRLIESHPRSPEAAAAQARLDDLARPLTATP